MTEAVRILERNGDRAKVLAGGQSLIPMMKLHLASPQLIVDINRIPGLEELSEEGDVLRIGALVRHRELERSRTIQGRYAVLSDAAASLGDPQVRSLGTIGGSLAHADAASDWGTALLAFESQVVITGPKGKRAIPIDDFFEDTFVTVLKPNEVLTEIRIPKPGARSGGAYLKLKRKTGDFATVAAATQLELGPKRSISHVRIGLAAVGPTPVRARRAEDSLRGKAPSPEAIAEAAVLAAGDAHPSADLRGSEEYKRAMVEVYTRRALEKALERAEK